MSRGLGGWSRAGVAAALAAACSGALAHAYLQRSEPPASAVLAHAPSELRLRFSEAVEPAFLDVRVLRNGQSLAAADPPRLDKDGKTLHVALAAPPDSAAGDYEVRWRIVAKDGHPTEGRYTFRVGAR